jgi:hypothetical protein
MSVCSLCLGKQTGHLLRQWPIQQGGPPWFRILVGHRPPFPNGPAWAVSVIELHPVLIPSIQKALTPDLALSDCRRNHPASHLMGSSSGGEHLHRCVVSCALFCALVTLRSAPVVYVLNATATQSAGRYSVLMPPDPQRRDLYQSSQIQTTTRVAICYEMTAMPFIEGCRHDPDW